MAFERKTALIVYAHPEPKSFNGALKDVAVATLQDVGYEVIVSDLYASHFNPVACKDDVFGTLTNPEFYRQEVETGAAFTQNRLSPDIVSEIEKLKEADLVIFQYPLYWLSMPAILKGWLDRVLVDGFAFTEGRWFSTGMMKGKRALLSLTTGGPEPMYSSAGLQGDINVILWPVQSGILGFCGFDVLPAQVNYAVAFTNDENRTSSLAKWRQRLLNIDSEQPLPATDVSMFDADKGYSLSEAALAAQNGKPHGLSIGTHLGKPFPPQQLCAQKQPGAHLQIVNPK